MKSLAENGSVVTSSVNGVVTNYTTISSSSVNLPLPPPPHQQQRQFLAVQDNNNTMSVQSNNSSCEMMIMNCNESAGSTVESHQINPPTTHQNNGNQRMTMSVSLTPVHQQQQQTTTILLPIQMTTTTSQDQQLNGYFTTQDGHQISTTTTTSNGNCAAGQEIEEIIILNTSSGEQFQHLQRQTSNNNNHPVIELGNGVGHQNYERLIMISSSPSAGQQSLATGPQPQQLQMTTATRMNGGGVAATPAAPTGTTIISLVSTTKEAQGGVTVYQAGESLSGGGGDGKITTTTNREGHVVRNGEAVICPDLEADRDDVFRFVMDEVEETPQETLRNTRQLRSGSNSNKTNGTKDPMLGGSGGMEIFIVETPVEVEKKGAIGGESEGKEELEAANQNEQKDNKKGEWHF